MSVFLVVAMSPPAPSRNSSGAQVTGVPLLVDIERRLEAHIDPADATRLLTAAPKSANRITGGLCSDSKIFSVFKSE